MRVWGVLSVVVIVLLVCNARNRSVVTIVLYGLSVWRSRLVMEVFVEEVKGLFASRSVDVSGVVGMKGLSDRVDAITLLVREVLRASSLCLIDGVLHIFDGRSYCKVDRAAVLASLTNVLTDLGFSPTDIRKMGDMPLSVVYERSYSRPDGLLCFTNGVLDISRMDFSSGFDPALRCVERMGYAYDAEAACPLWDSFLEEVLPDASVRAVLQEFFGLCYLDRRSLSVEKFLLMVGSGANGKSVIFDVMKAVMGADNVSTFDSRQLTDERMLPYVRGRRLNFAPDMRRASDFDSALKALASGQEVAGRRIYGDAEKVVCPPLVFALNEIPRFRDTTPAFFRRIIPILFDVVIPSERQDRALVRKIVAGDLPGIFNWVMRGRARLLEGGGVFSPSAAIDVYAARLRGYVDSRENPVRTYLASRGLSVYPSYEGQPSVRISQKEIAAAVGGLSPTAISREMVRCGASVHRSREIYYRVYQIQSPLCSD